MKLIPTLTYLAIGILLTVWWSLAFKNDQPSLSKEPAFIYSSEAATPNNTYLSKFDRHSLKKALSGDYATMADLIHQWDIDAQYLQQRGFTAIQRLTPEALLKSQLLFRKLGSKTKKSGGRFLPQTYVAASFLMAIAEPSQIVALPKGFRRQTALYPLEFTSSIEVDIDRHHSEALFSSQPDIAFIAPYSAPSTVEALRNQGIKLFSINSLDSFEDICKVLVDIGDATGCDTEAQLLKIFMEAAMLAIDNKVSYEKRKKPFPKTLYVSYHTTFSLPTKKNLTGQLLMRLGIMEHMEELELYFAQQQWSIPIDQEKIVNFKPDCLIISTDSTDVLKGQIEKNLTFGGLRAACQRITYVDEDIINSPTQYFVLAYYDLAQAVFNND